MVLRHQERKQIKTISLYCFMRKIYIMLIALLAIFMLFVGIRIFSSEDTWICENGDWVRHGNPAASMPLELCEQRSCETDSDCKTPMQFLVQSNCPFTSSCIEGTCAVVCPLFESTCSSDADCDCSIRGDRSMDCKCIDNSCVSVEAK
jgi:hypothetical protein